MKIRTKVFSMVATVSIAFALTACTDKWDEHYQTNAQLKEQQSLWELLSGKEELSDFCEIMDSAGYRVLLDEDQAFTVWAPVNGSFRKDSLLEEMANSHKKEVLKRFVENHLSRYSLSLSSLSESSLKLTNGKFTNVGYNRTENHYYYGECTVKEANIQARNGVLHILGGSLPFFYNLYEYLSYDLRLDSLNRFIRQFDEAIFDANSSVPYAVVDGKTIYIDSVTVDYNSLLEELGEINEEDSTFWLIAPTNEAWKNAYDEIVTYFNFSPSVKKRDSLVNYYSKAAILEDLFYNANLQKAPADSVTSTQYTTSYPEKHVYYQSMDRLFGGEKVRCSNGYAFVTNQWPFDVRDIFYREITIEAEREKGRTNTLSEVFRRENRSDSISDEAFIAVTPTNQSSNPSIVFTLPNVLSAAYDVYVVMVPQSAYNPRTKDFRANKVRITLTYLNEKGISKNYVCKDATNNNSYFITNPYRMDTLIVAKGFTYPLTEYGQSTTSMALTVQSSVKSSETTTYNRELMIDCILLKPHEADETEN